MSTEDTSNIVANAGLVVIDVYAAGVACDGNRVAADAPPATDSKRFAQGQPTTLAVTPGKHTVALTAFADAAGTVLVGAGCLADAEFQPGQAVCIDLTVTNVDLGAQGGNDDLSVCSGLDCPCMTDTDCANASQPRCGPAGVCVPCVSTHDNCPLNRYCDTANKCALGCKSSAECAELAAPDAGAPAADVLCATARHVCVECLQSTDCPVGKLCTPSGSCADGCDLAAGKGCAAGLTCCNNLCINTAADALNCGGCGAPCTGARNTCCSSGCVDPSADPLHCSGCARPCSTANNTPACDVGTCNFSCAAGFAHCASGNTGCETATNTISNCAGCGNVCNVTNANSASCASGTSCSYVCKTGFADCSNVGVNTDGCETNLNTDVSRCGNCATNCLTQTRNAAGVVCNGSGACDFSSCIANFADCNGVQADGCEVNLQGDVTHCGSCAINCTTRVVNATGVSCTSGGCNYAACNAGFADCNGDRADGCEINLNTDTTRCGLCTTNCNTTVQNASGKSCNGSGICTYTGACSAPFADCDTNRANGCEINLNTDTTRCGLCTTNCNTTVQNASGKSCNGSGICTYTGTCSSSFGDCDTNRANGCEIPTSTTSNCAACGNACDTLRSTPSSCNGTTCLYSACAAGFLNCNTTAPDVNGCETACTPPNATAGCSSGACAVASCNSGYRDCDGNASNGCECETDPAAPACCGSSCQIKHDTNQTPLAGGSRYFFDCVALDTYNSAQATKACQAYVGTSGRTCETGYCSSEAICVDPTPCSGGISCWTFTGSARGRTFFTASCSSCPNLGDPLWH